MSTIALGTPTQSSVVTSLLSQTRFANLTPESVKYGNERKFQDSARIQYRGGKLAPLLGYHPAKVHYTPLLSQAPAKSLVDEAIKTNIETETFRTAIANAFTNEPEEEIFINLEKVLTESGEHKTSLRFQKLALAISNFKASHIEAALLALDEFEEISKGTTDSLSLLASITRADLYLGKGIRLAANDRYQLFLRAYIELTEQSKNILNQLSLESMPQQNINALAEIYYYATCFFIDNHYPSFAAETAKILNDFFPNTKATKRLFNKTHSPLTDFISQNSITNIATNSFWERFKASAGEFIFNMPFKHNKYFWTLATAGILNGFTAQYLLNDNHFDMNQILNYGAIGGVALVSAFKLWNGFTNQQTIQAFKTGFTVRKQKEVLKKYAIEALKLVGAYAICGGEIPGLGYIPTFFEIAPVATAFPDLMMTQLQDNTLHSGHLHGLGSLLTNIHQIIAINSKKLGILIDAYGASEGFDFFISHMRETNHFFSSVVKGWEYIQGAASWWRHDAFDASVEFLHHAFAIKEGTSLPMTVAKSVGYLYMGAAATYTFANAANKNFRKNFQKWTKMTKEKQTWLEIFLFGGAHYTMAQIGIATGVPEFDAWTLPLAAYIPQIRHYIQGGGRGGFTSINFAAMMASGATLFLYAGPGAAMRSDIMSYHMFDYFQEHVGMSPYLVNFGVMHAILTGLSVKRTMQAKYAKILNYDFIGNLIKMLIGWTSFLGNMGTQFSKEIVTGAAVSNSFREASGSRIQKGLLYDYFRQLGELVESTNQEVDEVEEISKVRHVLHEKHREEVLQVQEQLTQDGKLLTEKAILAGKTDQGWQFLQSVFLNQSPENKLKLIPVLYYTTDHANHLIPQKLKVDEYNKYIYQYLVDKKSNPKVISEFLEQIAAILLDEKEGLEDVRENLMLTIIAAKGNTPHKDIFTQFFTKHVWLNELFSKNQIENFEKDPLPKPWRKKATRRWFDKNLTTGLTKHQQHVQRLDDAFAVAARRWNFLNPLTGHSVRAMITPVTAFLSSLGSKDPSFQTTPDHIFFRETIFAFLLDKKSGKTEVKGLLEFAKHYLSKVDYDRRDIQYNLLITLLAAIQPEGKEPTPHQDLVENFVKENSWMLSYYGIRASDVANPPRHSETPRAIKWFWQRLKSSDVSADGILRNPIYPKGSRYGEISNIKLAN